MPPLVKFMELRDVYLEELGDARERVQLEGSVVVRKSKTGRNWRAELARDRVAGVNIIVRSWQRIPFQRAACSVGNELRKNWRYGDDVGRLRRNELVGAVER